MIHNVFIPYFLNILCSKIVISRFVSVISSFAFLSVSFTCVSQAIVIDIDKEYQMIDGFGASDAWRCQYVGENWPESKKNQIADWLFSQELDENGSPKGIGLSLWRFYIGAGSAEQGVESGIANEWRRGESFIDIHGNYDWSKQAGQQWFLHKAKAAGVEKFLAFSIAPPTFWSLNKKGYANTKNGLINLKPEHFEDYSKFMIEVLKHFQNEGYNFEYLSPINEPQWDWEKGSQEGTPATNRDISALIRMLNKEVIKNDLDTKIMVGEAADLRFLYSHQNKKGRANQIKEFYGKSSKNKATYLGNLSSADKTISGHSYFTTTPVSSLISIRQDLKKSLDKHNLDYWQSEFCILENSEDIGGNGNTRDLGMATALYVARVIHADLTIASAKSWQWWTALTNADFKDGLIYLDTGKKDDLYNLESLKTDGDFHDSKLLWALGNFSRFIRPGMQRIAVDFKTNKNLEQQYEDLMISAYKKPKSEEVAVVFINYSDEEKVIDLSGQHLIFSDAYETSDSRNLSRRDLVDNILTLVPRSITTITTSNL